MDAIAMLVKMRLRRRGQRRFFAGRALKVTKEAAEGGGLLLWLLAV
jgi:hypothetical protein